MTARGLRNCNPLNIKKVAGVTWQGQTADQPDPIFVTFRTVPFGYRAATIILDNYQKLHALWTIRGMISRWSSTDQAAYIEHVAAACGVAPDETFALKHGDNTLKMERAMCVQENGSCPYDDSVILKGIDLARGGA